MNEKCRSNSLRVSCAFQFYISFVHVILKRNTSIWFGSDNSRKCKATHRKMFILCGTITHRKQVRVTTEVGFFKLHISQIHIFQASLLLLIGIDHLNMRELKEATNYDYFAIIWINNIVELQVQKRRERASKSVKYKIGQIKRQDYAMWYWCDASLSAIAELLTVIDESVYWLAMIVTN